MTPEEIEQQLEELRKRRRQPEPSEINLEQQLQELRDRRSISAPVEETPEPPVEAPEEPVVAPLEDPEPVPEQPVLSGDRHTLRESATPDVPPTQVRDRSGRLESARKKMVTDYDSLERSIARRDTPVDTTSAVRDEVLVSGAQATPVYPYKDFFDAPTQEDFSAFDKELRKAREERGEKRGVFSSALRALKPRVFDSNFEVQRPSTQLEFLRERYAPALGELTPEQRSTRIKAIEQAAIESGSPKQFTDALVKVLDPETPVAEVTQAIRDAERDPNFFSRWIKSALTREDEQGQLVESRLAQTMRILAAPVAAVTAAGDVTERVVTGDPGAVTELPEALERRISQAAGFSTVAMEKAGTDEGRIFLSLGMGPVGVATAYLNNTLLNMLPEPAKERAVQNIQLSAGALGFLGELAVPIDLGVTRTVTGAVKGARAGQAIAGATRTTPDIASDALMGATEALLGRPVVTKAAKEALEETSAGKALLEAHDGKPPTMLEIQIQRAANDSMVRQQAANILQNSQAKDAGETTKKLVRDAGVTPKMTDAQAVEAIALHEVSKKVARLYKQGAVTPDNQVRMSQFLTATPRVASQVRKRVQAVSSDINKAVTDLAPEITVEALGQRGAALRQRLQASNTERMSLQLELDKAVREGQDAFMTPGGRVTLDEAQMALRDLQTQQANLQAQLQHIVDQHSNLGKAKATAFIKDTLGLDVREPEVELLARSFVSGALSGDSNAAHQAVLHIVGGRTPGVTNIASLERASVAPGIGSMWREAVDNVRINQYLTPREVRGSTFFELAKVVYRRATRSPRIKTAWLETFAQEARTRIGTVDEAFRASLSRKIQEGMNREQAWQQTILEPYMVEAGVTPAFFTDTIRTALGGLDEALEGLRSPTGKVTRKHPLLSAQNRTEVADLIFDFLPEEIKGQLADPTQALEAATRVNAMLNGKTLNEILEVLDKGGSARRALAEAEYNRTVGREIRIPPANAQNMRTREINQIAERQNERIQELNDLMPKFNFDPVNAPQIYSLVRLQKSISDVLRDITEDIATSVVRGTDDLDPQALQEIGALWNQVLPDAEQAMFQIAREENWLTPTGTVASTIYSNMLTSTMLLGNQTNYLYAQLKNMKLSQSALDRVQGLEQAFATESLRKKIPEGDMSHFIARIADSLSIEEAIKTLDTLSNAGKVVPIDDARAYIQLQAALTKQVKALDDVIVELGGDLTMRARLNDYVSSFLGMPTGEKISTVYDAASRHVRGALLGGFGIPNLSYHFTNYLTAPMIIMDQLGLAAGGRALTRAMFLRRDSYKLSHVLTSGTSSKYADEIAVRAPDGSSYTYGQLAGLIGNGSLGRSQSGAELRRNIIDAMVAQRQTRLGFGQGPLPDLPAGESLWNRLADVSDQYFRMGVMMDALSEGRPVQEALRLAREALYDYGQLTNFEREWLTKFIWFWNFARNSYLGTMRNVLTNPTRTARAMKITRRFDDPTRENPDTSVYSQVKAFRFLLEGSEKEGRHGLYGPGVPAAEALSQLIDYVAIGVPMFNAGYTLPEATLEAMRRARVEGQEQISNVWLQAGLGMFFGIDSRRDGDKLSKWLDPRLVTYLQQNDWTWEAFKYFIPLEQMPQRIATPEGVVHDGSAWRVKDGYEKHWLAFQTLLLTIGIRRAASEYAPLFQDMMVATGGERPDDFRVSPAQTSTGDESLDALLFIMSRLQVARPQAVRTAEDQRRLNMRALEETF